MASCTFWDTIMKPTAATMERIEMRLRRELGIAVMPQLWETWTFVAASWFGTGLPIFSYITLIYRELGRMTTGRVHEHLEIFEAELNPN